MKVEVVDDARRIVRADGEIDLSNADRLGAALADAVCDCPKGFVVDLSGATYLDSAGIQVLLSAYRHVYDAGGRIAVVIAHPNVTEIFDVINAKRFPRFLLCNTLDDAMQALAG